MPDISYDDWTKSLESNFSRNKGYAVPDSQYTTSLLPQQENEFRRWVIGNNVPFNPDAHISDYDMRGFWMALQNKDKIATSSVNEFDGKIHYPDFWKTPYHETFSKESKWAIPDKAPSWSEDGRYLKGSDGKILFDSKEKSK